MQHEAVYLIENEPKRSQMKLSGALFCLLKARDNVEL